MVLIDFSELLKQICKEERISLKEISELSGISYSLIRQYASGPKSPGFENIAKIFSVPRLSKYLSLMAPIEIETTNLKSARISKRVNRLCNTPEGEQIFLKALDLVEAMHTDEEEPTSDDQ